MAKPLRYTLPEYNKKNQSGGNGSDYSGLWHSPTADNCQLSKYALQYINYTPMFNPFQRDTILATPTSGITPTGIYLAYKDKNVLPPDGFVQSSKNQDIGKTDK